MPPGRDGDRLEEAVGHEHPYGPPIYRGSPSRIEHVPDEEEGGLGRVHVDPGRLRPEPAVDGRPRQSGIGSDARVLFQDSTRGRFEGRTQGGSERRTLIRDHDPVGDDRRPRARLRRDVSRPRPHLGCRPCIRERRETRSARCRVDLEERPNARGELHEHGGVVVDGNVVRRPDECPVPQQLDGVVPLGVLQTEQHGATVGQKTPLRWVLVQEEPPRLPGQRRLDADEPGGGGSGQRGGDRVRPDVGGRVHAGLEQIGEGPGGCAGRSELGPPRLSGMGLAQRCGQDEFGREDPGQRGRPRGPVSPCDQRRSGHGGPHTGHGQGLHPDHEHRSQPPEDDPRNEHHQPAPSGSALSPGIGAQGGEHGESHQQPQPESPRAVEVQAAQRDGPGEGGQAPGHEVQAEEVGDRGVGGERHHQGAVAPVPPRREGQPQRRRAQVRARPQRQLERPQHRHPRADPCLGRGVPGDERGKDFQPAETQAHGGPGDVRQAGKEDSQIDGHEGGQHQGPQPRSGPGRPDSVTNVRG